MRIEGSRDRQRGVVMALFAMASIVVLLVTGLAVDLGIAHVALAKLSKAADAAALSGAKHASLGGSRVKQIAAQVAAANYGPTGSNPVKYSVTIDTPSADAFRVTVDASTTSPTFFARLMDRKSIDVKTVSEATRYPLDLSLILDLSGSLQRAGAFDDMQLASKNFIDHFDDSLDQVGIVTFSTWAWDLMTIRKNFKSLGDSLIDAQVAIADTNTEEGLRLGKRQLDSAPERERATKVAVLFTDGRPTAFADALRLSGTNADCGSAPDPLAFNKAGLKDADGDGIPDCWGGVSATYISGSSPRGIFLADTGMRAAGFVSMTPALAANGSSGAPYPMRLPGGKKVDGDSIRATGVAQAEEWANEIRGAGYFVYVIGLGNPAASDPGDVPDQDFLRRIANEKGIVNPSQPMGEMMFAPSAAELDSTFARLADRLLTRLTR